MMDVNKTSLKNSSLSYIKRAFLLHLLWYRSLQASVNRVKKLGACLFKVLLKHQSFLYSFICSISSIPLEVTLDLTFQAFFFFFFEVLFIGPGKARAALHYLDSNFYRKIIIHYYSLLSFLSFLLFLLLFTIIPFIQYTTHMNRNIFIIFCKKLFAIIMQKAIFHFKIWLKIVCKTSKWTYKTITWKY